MAPRGPEGTMGGWEALWKVKGSSAARERRGHGQAVTYAIVFDNH